MGGSIALTTGDGRAAARARHLLERFDVRLSRFDPASELSRLNADPRATVPASTLLRTAIRAAVWAAERSDGLVDPTLLAALRRQGYRDSLAGRAPASLSDALASAPPRRACGSQPQALWPSIAVDDEAGTITRPPGLALDTGGTTKGLAADAAAAVLGAGFVVDCAGDIRVDAPEPLAIAVEHPLTGEYAHTLHIAAGAVATSGLGRRIWRRSDGSFAHHLLDPATGDPAWTGVLQVSALAPSALEAETLAKAALLSGPADARGLLARHEGGVLIHDDGTVEVVAPIANERQVAA